VCVLFYYDSASVRPYCPQEALRFRLVRPFVRACVRVVESFLRLACRRLLVLIIASRLFTYSLSSTTTVVVRVVRSVGCVCVYVCVPRTAFEENDF